MIVMLTLALIGRCDYFGFGFRTLIEKRSRLAPAPYMEYWAAEKLGPPFGIPRPYKVSMIDGSIFPSKVAEQRK